MGGSTKQGEIGNHFKTKSGFHLRRDTTHEKLYLSNINPNDWARLLAKFKVVPKDTKIKTLETYSVLSWILRSYRTNINQPLGKKPADILRGFDLLIIEATLVDYFELDLSLKLMTDFLKFRHNVSEEELNFNYENYDIIPGNLSAKEERQQNHDIFTYVGFHEQI